MYAMFMIGFCLHFTTKGHVHIFLNIFHILRSAFFFPTSTTSAVHLKHNHMQLLMFCGATHIVLPISKSQHTVYGVASIFYLVAVITLLCDVQKVQHSVDWPTKSGFYFVQSCKKKDPKKQLMVGTKTTCSQNSKPTVLVIFEHLIRGL